MVVLALLGALAVATPPTIAPLTAPDGTPGVQASFVVDAPPSVVLDLLWDVRRFQRIFPDIKRLTVLHRAATEVEVRFEVDAVVATPTYTLRRNLDVGKGEIRWVNTAGDLKTIVGRWVVAPAASRGQSHVIYESFVDVGVFGVSGIYRDIVISKLDQMALRVQTAATAAMLPPIAPPATVLSTPAPSAP